MGAARWVPCSVLLPRVLVCLLLAGRCLTQVSTRCLLTLTLTLFTTFLSLLIFMKTPPCLLDVFACFLVLVLALVLTGEYCISSKCEF